MGLVLLLVMAVVVAIVMSVASRSLSDTVVSRQESESAAALGIAETGVEQALNSLRLGTVPVGTINLSDSGGLITGSYGVTATTGYGMYVREGETAQLDLSSFAGGNLVISWTKRGNSSEDIATCTEGSGTMPAALEVSSINVANTMARSYYNPSNCSPAGNQFASGSDPGNSYRTSISYAVPAGTASLRLRPIYAGATIEVAGAGLTENQMYVIAATARGSEAQKEIEVKRGVDAPAPVFDYALFSGTTIIK